MRQPSSSFLPTLFYFPSFPSSFIPLGVLTRGLDVELAALTSSFLLSLTEGESLVSVSVKPGADQMITGVPPHSERADSPESTRLWGEAESAFSRMV